MNADERPEFYVIPDLIRGGQWNMTPAEFGWFVIAREAGMQVEPADFFDEELETEAP